MRSSRSAAAALVALAVLGAALLVLATLQYRWIGQLADAERARMSASLDFAAHHYADEFDRELGRMFAAFQMPLSEATPENVLRHYNEWAASTRDARLIEAVYFVPAGDADAVQRIDPRAQRAYPTQWPHELADVREMIATDFAGGHPAPPLRHDAAVILVPSGGGMRRRMRMPGDPSPAFTVVQLDRDYLTRVLLPELTHRYFDAPGGNACDVEVAALNVGEVLYRSDDAPGAFNAEIAVPIFTFRIFHPDAAGPAPEPPPDAPRWQLRVRRRAGSLEATVNATRRRNLLVTGGMLAVLAGSGVALVLLLRRAERLRRQQLEFVAGVTHELNTPIAALRSAGQNLADGVTHEPAQVARYGLMIVKESRRLGDMVAQVLQFAGMQEPHERVDQPVDLVAVIDDALGHCRSMCEQERVTVDVHVDRDLPRISGDPAALGRALQNLISNAVKYGGASKWVGVRARRDGRGRVCITVDDGGDGVAADDARHLFEPFFRGRGADRVRGSGLGLTIVKRIVDEHGGEIVVGRSSRGGASFTIALPEAAHA
jgi:signal transduction histidine kinase